MPPDPSRAGWWLLLFFVLLLPCLGVVCWNEIAEDRSDTALGTISAIGQAMAQFVILMGAIALFVVEGIPMFAEQFLKRRHEEGREQGREERDQEWRQFYDALRAELAQQGIEISVSPPEPILNRRNKR